MRLFVFALVPLFASVDAPVPDQQTVATDTPSTVTESVDVEGQSGDTVSVVVPPEGAIIELPGVARVIIPAAAFDSARRVSVYVTDHPATPEGEISFDVGNGPRPPFLPYDLRIRTAGAPSHPIEVILFLPDSYLAALVDEATPRAYATEEGGGAQESLTVYSALDSSFDTTAGVLHVYVNPQQALAMADGATLAIVTVGR